MWWLGTVNTPKSFLSSPSTGSRIHPFRRLLARQNESLTSMGASLQTTGTLAVIFNFSHFLINFITGKGLTQREVRRWFCAMITGKLGRPTSSLNCVRNVPCLLHQTPHTGSHALNTDKPVHKWNVHNMLILKQLWEIKTIYVILCVFLPEKLIRPSI